ncbi:MAG: serine hydrolase [Bacilli bacterium]|nr:serine hydrolase [Bacilli bacterium]
MDGMNRLIEQAIAEGVFPGANFALIIKGKTTFGSFGAKALYPAYEANDLSTLYDMASCSKVVSTTSCIMKLLEAGRLRLFDSVSTYLPFFEKTNVTIWDLMTHTSGLPPLISRSLYKTKEELITLIQKVDMKYEKNTKIVYSDLGFILLGWIVEAISGKSLAQFAKEQIFDPLEMKDTTYNPTDVARCAPTEDRGDKIDRGYVHDEAAHTLGGVAGHAGLFSTVEDISHFMEMILNQGLYRGKRIFSPQTINLLYTVQVEEPNGIAKALNRRGLGWLIKGDYPCSGDLVSPETIMHTGFTGTHIFIDRTNQVAFCMLTNRVHPTRENIKIIAFRGRLGNYIMSHI